ncbi:hypothetical protein [Faecalibaculum rodentium]|uniref:hypothetical protein n=1 Tax=Faecalibaculum rodentium TaxID=1702221 RepID=UPI003F673A2C
MVFEAVKEQLLPEKERLAGIYLEDGNYADRSITLAERMVKPFVIGPEGVPGFADNGSRAEAQQYGGHVLSQSAIMNGLVLRSSTRICADKAEDEGIQRGVLGMTAFPYFPGHSRTSV